MARRGSVLDIDDGDGEMGPRCRARLDQLAPRGGESR